MEQQIRGIGKISVFDSRVFLNDTQLKESALMEFIGDLARKYNQSEEDRLVAVQELDSSRGKKFKSENIERAVRLQLELLKQIKEEPRRANLEAQILSNISALINLGRS